jgi:hypothetical protein
MLLRPEFAGFDCPDSAHPGTAATAEHKPVII